MQQHDSTKITIRTQSRETLTEHSMKPNYKIVEDTQDRMVLKDIGPWDKHKTVTNGAEDVVAELSERLGERQLFYYDSEGELAEIIHKNGKFLRYVFPDRENLTTNNDVR